MIASVSGVVFVDVNEDGVYQANEPGIDGVLIDLSAALPPWFPWVSRFVTTAAVIGWFWRVRPKRWLQRPPLQLVARVAP